MAKRVYIGINDVARKVKKMYVGVQNFTPRTLPSGYTQVEYIESSGTQYIDVGFVPNQDTRVFAEVEFATASSTQALFGARTSSSANQFQFVTSGNAYRTDYNTAYTNMVSASISGKFYVDKNKNVTNLNGSETYTHTYASFTAPGTMYLFATNNNGSVYAYASAKLYSFMVYDNGTMIRDCVPCTNASGTVGLYDVVNGKFYTNAGTGVFTAGPICKGVARKVKKGYIGIGGVARPFWTGGELVYYGTITAMSSVRTLMATARTDKHAIFAGGFLKNSFNLGGTVNNADAYNASLTRSIISSLTSAGYGPSMGAGAGLGEYALFAGGSTGNAYSYAYVTAINTSLTVTNPTSLSQARCHLSGATVGDYALFAGGYESNIGTDYYATVDAYNKSLTRSNPTALSKARRKFASATVGGYAIFAGGSNGYKIVDAYNASLTRTVPTTLNTGRTFHAGTSVGNYAIFAGGMPSGSSNPIGSAEAYDTSLTRITATDLSVSRMYLAATNIEGFAIFAGGYTGYPSYTNYNTVDVYDESLTRTAGTSISKARFDMCANTIGNYALFAGGSTYDGDAGDSISVVDAYMVG